MLLAVGLGLSWGTGLTFTSVELSGDDTDERLVPVGNMQT